MGRASELAEQLWTGAASTVEHNPLTTFLGLEVLRPGLAFVSSLANVVALETADGLVLIDTGGHLTAGAVEGELRRWSKAPVHTAIYTHGHVDHVCGAPRYDAEAARLGRPAPRVVAHWRVADRFDRYKLTAGYNGHINARQFRVPGLAWPVDYRYPDQTYRDHLALEVGGLRLELHHDRGETDDHTWVWIPAHRALCTGDLFIWAAPNCGNPQKVQRYPREWAAALDKMAALAPELLLPGHGPPIAGAERCAQALAETAALLGTLHDQTVALMNDGLRLDQILAAVEVPAALLARPYLRPVYDQPDFIVRNTWRLYGGWYDGNPARLEPPPDPALAAEVARLAGGVPALIGRAEELAAAGDLATACQLAEWAWQAAPDDAAAAAARAAIYRRRATAAGSMMARGIYLAAAAEPPPGRGR
jgi:alkyl sulfatase BDS1-like metallo-beta-lactamase superfamily hydrolase